MSNHDFTLKSGENLHITTPPFEESVALIEVVKKVTLGMDPTTELDSLILANPEVRRALYPCFQYALWGIHKVSPALFDDPKLGDKAKGDYFEICSRIIEVTSRPFFLTLSSKSTTPTPPPSGNPE